MISEVGASAPTYMAGYSRALAPEASGPEGHFCATMIVRPEGRTS